MALPDSNDSSLRDRISSVDATKCLMLGKKAYMCSSSSLTTHIPRADDFLVHPSEMPNTYQCWTIVNGLYACAAKKHDVLEESPSAVMMTLAARTGMADLLAPATRPVMLAHGGGGHELTTEKL